MDKNKPENISEYSELKKIIDTGVPLIVMYYNKSSIETVDKVMNTVMKEFGGIARIYGCNLSTVNGANEIWGFELSHTRDYPVLLTYKNKMKALMFTKFDEAGLESIKRGGKKIFIQKSPVKDQIEGIEEQIKNFTVIAPTLGLRKCTIDDVLKALNDEKKFKLKVSYHN